MEKQHVLDQIKRLGAVAVIRAQSEEQAMELTSQCVQGGLTIVELTFTTPNADGVIRRLDQEFGDAILLGAGTVMNAQTSQLAMAAGARFVVSPHFDPEIVAACNKAGVPAACGTMTITEMVAAMNAGCDLLKLFPAGPLGPGYLKAVLGPLPHAQIMPTGGISPDNAAQWIRAGAVAVGAGGSLFQGNVAQNAARLLEQVRIAREENL